MESNFGEAAWMATVGGWRDMPGRGEGRPGGLRSPKLGQSLELAAVVEPLEVSGAMATDRQWAVKRQKRADMLAHWRLLNMGTCVALVCACAFVQECGVNGYKAWLRWPGVYCVNRYEAVYSPVIEGLIWQMW